jgi:transposase-like protein
MALKPGVNVNQLHKWIRDVEREEAMDEAAECMAPAFMPVVTLGEVSRSVSRPWSSRLRCRRVAKRPPRHCEHQCLRASERSCQTG